MAPPNEVPDKVAAEEGETKEVDENINKYEGKEQGGVKNDGDAGGNDEPLSTTSSGSSAPERDEEDDTACAPTETSAIRAPSSIATSTTTAADEEDDEDDDDEMEETPPKFYVTQRVYGRDEPTGLLYEAVVRRVMRGPRSRQINVHLLSKEEAERLQENNTKNKDGGSADVDLGFVLDDFDEGGMATHCWHYFVHYMGWNVRWDRWVEEDSLYEDTEGTKILADKLKAEMRKMKHERKGKTKKVKDSEVVALRRRMRQLEEERRREERKEQLAPNRAENGEESNENSKHVEEEPNNENSEDGEEEPDEKTPDNDPPSSRQKNNETEHSKEDTTTAGATKKEKGKKVQLMRLSKKAIEREIGLRERDLESRRNQIYAEKIVLPFTLKKVMVEEWEIISQCEMVPDLPASMTVRDVLNRYLESKVDMLRSREKGLNDVSETIDLNKDKGQQEHTELEKEESSKCTNSDKDDTFVDGKQEWVDMIEGIALYFDQALPTRLLFQHEIKQHSVIMRSSTKDPTLADRRISEIYGCEHLLRLFVRLPALIAESHLPEMETRQIYAKIGDLVRFLQKHQAEFFTQSYRKPRSNEIVAKRGAGRGRKRANAGSHGEEDDTKTRSKRKVASLSSDKDIVESDGFQSDVVEMEIVPDEHAKKKQTRKKAKNLPKNVECGEENVSGSKRRRKKETIASTSTQVEEEGRGEKKAAGRVERTKTIDRRRSKKVCTEKDSALTKITADSNKRSRRATKTSVEVATRASPRKRARR